MTGSAKGLRLNRDKQKSGWDWKRFIDAAKIVMAVVRLVLDVLDKFKK
jgi:hypothetical protein